MNKITIRSTREYDLLEELERIANISNTYGMTCHEEHIAMEEELRTLVKELLESGEEVVIEWIGKIY